MKGHRNTISAKIPEKTLTFSLIIHCCIQVALVVLLSSYINSFTDVAQLSSLQQRFTDKNNCWITTPIELHVATCLWKWGFGLKIQECALLHQLTRLLSTGGPRPEYPKISFQNYNAILHNFVFNKITTHYTSL